MIKDKNHLVDKYILEVIERNQDDIKKILYNDETERLKQENLQLKQENILLKAKNEKGEIMLELLKNFCRKLFQNDETIINDEHDSTCSEAHLSQIKKLTEQLSRLGQEKDSLQSENNHLKSQLDKYQSKIGQLTGQIDQLTAQIEQLKEKQEDNNIVKLELLFNKLTLETKEGLKNALRGKGETLFWKALKNIKTIWEYTKFLIIEEKRLEDVDILRDMMNILIAVDDEYTWDEVKIGDRFSEIDHIKAPSSTSNSGYITEILLKGLKKGNKQITNAIIKVER
jgi:FtsZ-binding cell division protein ZapB